MINITVRQKKSLSTQYKQQVYIYIYMYDHLCTVYYGGLLIKSNKLPTTGTYIYSL